MSMLPTTANVESAVTVREVHDKTPGWVWVFMLLWFFTGVTPQEVVANLRAWLAFIGW